MNEDVLISVIIPAYNCEKYLIRCLESLKKQSFTQYEVIIIDDGSIDNTGKIAKTFVKDYNNFKYIYQHNLGVSSARNCGIENSRGKYITFIDSDDWIEKDYLYMLYTTINSNNISVCYSGYNIYSEGRLVKRCRENKKFESFTAETFIPNSYYFYGSCWAGIFEKKCFEVIRFPSDISYGEDMITVARVIEKYNGIGFVNYPLYNYEYNHEGALSSTYKYDNKKLDKIKALKIVENLFADNNSSMRIMKGRIAEASMSLITNFYYDNDFSKETKKSLITEYRNNFKYFEKRNKKDKLQFLLFYISPDFYMYFRSKTRKRKK